MRHKLFYSAVILPVMSIATASVAQASNVQTTMAVTATNANSCAVLAQPLAFGTVNQVSGAVTDTQTTITVSCTPGIAYNVGLDTGAHATAGVRQMQALLGTALIPYSVFSDSARATSWGNSVGVDTVARTASALPTSLTVYGRIPAGSGLVASGAYTDLVTVTVTF